MNNPVIKNVLAVVAGWFIGSIVNFTLIILGNAILPLPGVESIWDMEAAMAAIPLAEPKHFIFPFLAHALGALVGAYTAVKMGANKHMLLALIIGGMFLIGGIVNSINLGAPMSFNILDIVFAYIPMAYLGYSLAGKGKQ